MSDAEPLSLHNVACTSNHLYWLSPLKQPTRQLQRVQQSGTRNNGCAVLVVVEYRDVHAALCLLLHIEALWRLHVSMCMCVSDLLGERAVQFRHSSSQHCTVG